MLLRGGTARVVHVCSTQSGARVSKTGFQVDGGVFAALKVDQAPAEDKKMLGIAAHHAMGTLPTIQRELFEHATSLADLSSERQIARFLRPIDVRRFRLGVENNVQHATYETSLRPGSPFERFIPMCQYSFE
jgi:hypothetical protein